MINPILTFLRTAYNLMRKTLIAYRDDRVLRMGAALSYYTIFSLPPIILIVIASVGFLFGEDAIREQIYLQLESVFGPEGTTQIQEIVQNIDDQERNWWATLVGIGVLLFGATGVFYALQEALNTIFGVQSNIKEKGGIWYLLTNRVLSFTMVIALGFILLVSLVLNALLIAVSIYLASHQTIQDLLPDWTEVLQDHFYVLINTGLSFLVFTLFFAVLYKVLPDAKLKWKHILLGSFITATLFWFGEILLGFYLGNSNLLSAYGAAGSVVVILIWVFYSAQLVFLGAEFIKVYMDYRNYPVEPRDYAVRVRDTIKRVSSLSPSFSIPLQRGKKQKHPLNQGKKTPSNGDSKLNSE
ncbi:MAG: YihY/virulence factor BrkB family protein [Bacteroidota bacterium]